MKKVLMSRGRWEHIKTLSIQRQKLTQTGWGWGTYLCNTQVQIVLALATTRLTKLSSWLSSLSSVMAQFSGRLLKCAWKIWIQWYQSPPLANSERAFFPGDPAKFQAWLLGPHHYASRTNRMIDCTVREAVVQLCSQVDTHTHPVFLYHSLLSSFKVRSALEPKPLFFGLGWQPTRPSSPSVCPPQC